MNKFSLTHEINCDVATFWKIFLDKEFNEALYRALDFNSFNIVEQTDGEKTVTRKVVAQPKVKNVPGPIAKLMGSSFGYTELGTFDKAAQTWRWTLATSVMTDKIKQEGLIRVDPMGGDKKVKRTGEMSIEAKIFGLGGMIESMTEKQLREAWEASAVFMNKWIAEHPST